MATVPVKNSKIKIGTVKKSLVARLGGLRQRHEWGEAAKSARLIGLESMLVVIHPFCPFRSSSV